MKLYNDNLSPYCARVRIQIYHKQLPIDIVDPPGGLRSDEFKRQVPLGRVPTLNTGDRLIGESTAIMEYLEDRYPEPAMRPASPEAVAQIRMISSAYEAYAQSELRKLFMLSRTGGDDREALQEAADKLKAALGQLEASFEDGSFAVGNSMTLADCVLAPSFHFTAALPAMLGLDPIIDESSRLGNWWQTVRQESAVQTVLAEIDTAFQAMLAETQDS